MKFPRSLNYYISAVGESLLLIWWGVVIVIDPLTVGIGAIGSGLILLGMNAIRMLNHIHPKRRTSIIGTIALGWGALDQALKLPLGASFAVLLIVTGMTGIVFCLFIPRKSDPSPA